MNITYERQFHSCFVLFRLIIEEKTWSVKLDLDHETQHGRIGSVEQLQYYQGIIFSFSQDNLLLLYMC